MEHRESRKSAQLIAYALIALGTVIALNELTLNYWPIMLIAVSAAFLISKKTRILAMLGLFTLGAGYYLFQPTNSQAQTQTSSLTQSIEQNLEGATKVTLELLK